MESRAAVTGWRQMQRSLGVDLPLALVLGVLSQLETWTNPLVRPRLAAVAAYLAITLSLALRRRRPLGVAVFVATIGNLPYLLGVPRSEPFVPVVALALVTYTVAAYTESAPAIAGLSAVLVFSWIPILTASGPKASDLIYVALLISAAWGVGRALRLRLAKAVAAEHRALDAERERDDAARLAVAEERGRIARELHDIVAHGLSLMIVQAGAAEQVLGRDPQRAEGPLRSIQDTGRQALADMKRLLGLLRVDEDQVDLAPQPSLARIDRLIADMRDAGLPVVLSVEGEARVLPAGVDLCAYRVVQEALTNSLRHARPSTARVALRYGEQDLELEVIDDGAEPTSGANGHGGHGLIGMRERVALYGGRLEVGRRADGGYGVWARLPLHPE